MLSLLRSEGVFSKILSLDEQPIINEATRMMLYIICVLFIFLMLIDIVIDSSNANNLHLFKIYMPFFLHIFIHKSLLCDKFFVCLFCFFCITSINFWVNICIRCTRSNSCIVNFFRCNCECLANNFSEIIFCRKERKHSVKASFVCIVIESKSLFACFSIT